MENYYNIQLYNLSKVTWEESQLLYHSLALLGSEFQRIGNFT